MIRKETKNNIKIILILVTYFIMISMCNMISKQQKTINELTDCVKDLVEVDKEQTEQIEELWKNIDAISIDYNQLYNEVYKEVE